MKFRKFTKKRIDEFLQKNSVSKAIPLELPPDEEKNFESKLVWIFASPRSGTQWLGTQLLEYNTQLCHGPSIGLNLGSIHSGFEDKIVRQIEFRGNETDYFFSHTYKKVWQYLLRKFILNRLHAQFQNITTKLIMPDPEGSIAGDIIAQCVPNSKLIILFRDGRDVVDSVIDAGKPNSWHIKSRGVTPVTPKNRARRIRIACKRWVKQIEVLNDAYNNHSPVLRLKIKYEDLRQNTLDELRKIYNFIEVDIPEDELKKIVEKYSFENISADKKGSGKVTRSASPGKWKENFSEEEQTVMYEIMRETLQKSEYP